MSQHPDLTSEQQRDFATASISKIVIKFGVPGALGMLFAGVQAIVDGLFIGRFVGADALASVNIVMPIYSVIVAVCVVVGVGALTVMAMSQGSGEIDRANNALRTLFLFLLLFSVAATAIIQLTMEPLVTLMGADEVLFRDSSEYLKTLSLFIPTMAITFMGDYYLRAVGKPLHGLALITTTVALNILLDYLLIAQLGWGVRGAAVATGVSFALTAIFALYFMIKSKSSISLCKGEFQWRLLGRMLYNGSSEGVSEVSAGIALLLFNVAMMNYVGSAGVAAFAAVNYSMYTAILIFVGTSNGLVPTISYAFGAKDRRRLFSIARANIIVNAAVGIIIFVILYFGGDTLVSLFFSEGDSTAKEVAIRGAKIVAFAPLFSGVVIAISSLFTAIGDAKRSVIISLLRGLVFILIGIYTLPYFFGVDGIWATILWCEILTLIIASVILYSRHKQEGM